MYIKYNCLRRIVSDYGIEVDEFKSKYGYLIMSVSNDLVAVHADLPDPCGDEDRYVTLLNAIPLFLMEETSLAMKNN